MINKEWLERRASPNGRSDAFIALIQGEGGEVSNALEISVVNKERYKYRLNVQGTKSDCMPSFSIPSFSRSTGSSMLDKKEGDIWSSWRV